MTPLRGLIFCGTAWFLYAFILALQRSGNLFDGSTASKESRRMRRLRSFFNMNGPDGFFPPSAMISLTNDNSTFFMARPAFYGPSLPESGLTGLLWVGSGFGEDSAASKHSILHGSEQLGCSDVPDWQHSKSHQHSGTREGASDPKHISGRQGDYSTERATFKRRETRETHDPSEALYLDEGRDVPLHSPHAASPTDGSSEQQRSHVDGLNSVATDDDSDALFLQESAEIVGKVVLLSRGGCGFLDKTNWVQRRGGAALIVGNNIREPTLINMYASEGTENITIPSVFTSYTSAHLLSSLLPPDASLKETSKNSNDMPPLLPPMLEAPEPQDGLWVTITPTMLSPGPFFDTLLVLVISPLVTLTIVYALLLLRARLQRRRWRAPKAVVERLPVRVYHTMSSPAGASTFTPSADTASVTTPLLQPNQPQVHPLARLQSQSSADNGDSSAFTLERQRAASPLRLEKRKFYGTQLECVICLEEYVDGESQVMSLPCGHEYHAECITPWLTTRRRTCPICKGDVVRSLADSLDVDPQDSATAGRGEDGLDSPALPLRMQSDEDAGTDVERAQTQGEVPQRSFWRVVSRLWNRNWNLQQTVSANGHT